MLSEIIYANSTHCNKNTILPSTNGEYFLTCLNDFTYPETL